MVGRRLHHESGASVVVRQRLVEANHHARECNAPDSLSVNRRFEWRLK